MSESKEYDWGKEVGREPFWGSDGEHWLPLPSFRYVLPAGTTTEKPILQQLWKGHQGSQRWQTVPLEIVSDDEFARALTKQ